MGLIFPQVIPSTLGPNWQKKCLEKGTIKVKKLILKERKRGLLDKKGVFSKDLFKNKHYTISCKGSK